MLRAHGRNAIAMLRSSPATAQRVADRRRRALPVPNLVLDLPRLLLKVPFPPLRHQPHLRHYVLIAFALVTPIMRPSD
jgi:hypothetical protein